jgi:hypothetical protein
MRKRQSIIDANHSNTQVVRQKLKKSLFAETGFSGAIHFAGKKP